MENNDFCQNYTCINVLNPSNKYLSPSKGYQINQLNSYFNRENISNNSFNNNSLSCYATPKKDFHSFEPDFILSPYVSNSKIDYVNNNLLTTLRKNSINDMSSYKQMINSPCNNSKFVEKK